MKEVECSLRGSVILEREREREREKQVGLDIVQYSFDCVAKDPIIVAKSLTTKVPVPSSLLTSLKPVIRRTWWSKLSLCLARAHTTG